MFPADKIFGQKREPISMSIFVIILEDEYWTRKTLSRLCSELSGVKVVGEFENATQALAFARGNQVDAAIIDILLPNDSGFEIGKTMKTEIPELNLIFTSAVDAYENRINEYGGSSFLHKPVVLKELQRALGLTK